MTKFPRKLQNLRWRAFTDEAIPVPTTTRTYVRYGIVHVESFGGEHYFLRKPKAVMVEYMRRGYPFGKTIRGLKRFARSYE